MVNHPNRSSRAKLLAAYETIMMLFLRRKITREERDARIVALRDTPIAAGLSFEERDALATEAACRAGEIMNEAWFSPSRGTWQ